MTEPHRFRISVRLRLALSYALFLEAAGGVTLIGVYVLLRYAPSYPQVEGNPLDLGRLVGSRTLILQAVVGASAAIMIALALMGIIGGWILSGWILRPLRRIHDGATIVATGRLDHRIGLTNRNDEFSDLADTFDAMLDRLQDAFDTQERFAANASHELRTPLTIMNTMLDVARRDPEGQDYPRLIERLSITNTRAIGLTEALLRLADANAITATSEPLDLAVIVRASIAENAPEAQRATLSIDTDLTPTPMVGDRYLLTQLVGNLIQNAIRHNVPSGFVSIRTESDRRNGNAILRVDNSGPYVAPALVSRLTEPFLRGEGRSARGRHDRSGHGLGLALVARITEVHHGSLAVASRGEGGLIVTATFPPHR